MNSTVAVELEKSLWVLCENNKYIECFLQICISVCCGPTNWILDAFFFLSIYVYYVAHCEWCERKPSRDTWVSEESPVWNQLKVRLLKDQRLKSVEPKSVYRIRTSSQPCLSVGYISSSYSVRRRARRDWSLIMVACKLLGSIIYAAIFKNATVYLQTVFVCSCCHLSISTCYLAYIFYINSTMYILLSLVIIKLCPDLNKNQQRWWRLIVARYAR